MKLYNLHPGQSKWWLSLLFALFVLTMPISAMATDDDVPFFAGRTGSPNVMIIFDNSNSMQDSPYKRADGRTYSPDTEWRRGVEINPDCDGDLNEDDPCIKESGGSIEFNELAYITTDAYINLPGINPPNLPGLSASDSTVTYIRNTSAACSAGMECDNRLYDSNVDWAYFDDSGGTSAWAKMAYTYRYWQVKITDTVDHSEQYRSLDYFNKNNGYWTVYGDPIEYNPAHAGNIVYELVAGSPGEVTYEQTDRHLVYDRRFDWSSISSWSAFNYSIYKNSILEVYAGTNIGERRKITDRNSSSGYWKVETNFSLPCDFTTRYRILGVADDNKKATGGNHPDSKMYQAKQALQKFLTSSAITTCDATDVSGNCIDTRYLMNIGFATFMQARMPQTRAKYYRKRGVHHPARFSYYYRANYSHSQNVYSPTGCSNGNPPTSTTIKDPWTGGNVTLSNGDTIDRLYQNGNCSEQTIRYKATISCNPTDSLPDRVRVKLESNNSWTDSALAGVDPNGNPQWGYTWYGWRYFEDMNNNGDCADTTNFTPPDPDGSRELVQPGETCYRACRNHPEWTEQEYYETTWKDVWGDLRKTDPATPGYIEKNPLSSAKYIVTPYKGYCAGSWNCTSPDPEDISGDGYGDWTLLESDLIDVPIRNNGNLGTITSEIFDYSDYRYPGKNNDPDHPHGWSYKRTTNPKLNNNYKKDGVFLDDHFIYASGGSYPAIWPDTEQKDPYFPSESFGEFTNYQGDDQVVFVDLPEYDDTAADKGDDYDGNNVQKVLSYINLSRHEYPRKPWYVHTMAPISKGALAVNYSTAQTGNGTPLAATLADARKYLKSYMEQDPYSQGGCRQNYIILLTDGTETAGGDPVAEAQALQNLVINGEPRPVKVYVVGFGLGLAEKTFLNTIAAAGAPPDDDGNPATAYFANNVDELANILAHDITSDILGGSYGRGSMGITRGGQDTKDGLTLYNGYFDYPIWRGHLEAYDLYTKDVHDSDTGELLHRAGSIKGPASHWAAGCSGVYDPPSAPGDPDGGCIMAENNMTPGDPPDGPLVRRLLYTTKADGTRVEFSPDNVTDLKALVNPNGDDIDGDGTLDANLDAKAVINYIHHPGFDSGKYAGTRDPNWPLGDIYNSGPVIVQGPFTGGCVGKDTNDDGVVDHSVSSEWYWANMDGYCQFQENHKARKGVLYFGTNGGMIQALTTGRPETVTIEEDGTETTNSAVTGGEELWGYIPGFVLSKLHEIKDGHRFTMDLDILAGEVDTSTGLTGVGWKTMLVAGQRKGGSHYLALDVTDPDNPQPMWEFSDPNLGQTWSRPSFGRILIEGVKTSVVFFGGGYSPDADTGNRIYIVKAVDGTILKEIEVGSTTNNVPSTLRTMRYQTSKTGTVVDYRTNMAQLPDGTAIDYSGRRGFIEVIYFGDTSGTVWRLSNLNSESGYTWNPTLDALYIPDSTKARPIYYPPVVYDVKKGEINNGTVTGCVKRYLMVGTGDEHDPIATKTGGGAPLLDYFFEIEDREWNIDEDDTAHAPAWTLPDDQNNGRFRLNWRFSLGLQLPTNADGFLLNPAGDGSLMQKNGQDILSSYIYIIKESTFTDDLWTLDASGNLISPDGELVAYTGEFLFMDTLGALYRESSLTTLVAAAGSYTQVDISLWLTDENGWFYDADDGTPLVDTSLYHYDNEGFWDDGLGTRRVIDGEYIGIVSDPGEKMLGVPAGYAGYVYFTTYTPEGGCATGASYFYGLKASSCSLAGGKGTLEHYPDATPIHSAPHRRISLGGGIATGVTLGGGTAYLAVRPGSDPIDVPVTTGNTALKYWKQN